MNESVKDWITGHGLVDSGLQIVVLALFLVSTLMAISGCFYWLWWLVRLLRPTNIREFVRKEIPGLRKGKLAGQEFEVGTVTQAERTSLKLASGTIEELSLRVGSTEESLKKLEAAFARLEGVRVPLVRSLRGNDDPAG